MKYSSKEISDIIEWDKENWKQSILFFDKYVDFKPSAKCLELGARRGGLSLWLALNSMKDIVCSDYIDNKESATEMHKDHGLDFIKYRVINALDIGEIETYDLVCFKSILGGIGSYGNSANQEKVIDEIYKVLKPGGKLVFAENLEGSAFHMFMRKKLVKWGVRWNYLTINDLKRQTKQFKKVTYKTAGFFGAFGGGSERARVILGKIDYILAPLIPQTKKYIAFFVCEK